MLSLFAIILIVSSFKKKAYPYFISGVICLVYSVLYPLKLAPSPVLLKSIGYTFVDNCELYLPFVLLVCVFYISRKKNQSQKRNYLPAVISVVICITRIARAIWSRNFIQKVIAAGSEAYQLTDYGILCNNINTVVIMILYSALILVLLWHMKKYSNTMV